MSRITPLYELQEIDNALQHRVLRMRQIDGLMDDSPALLAVRASAQASTDALTAEHARLRTASQEVDDTSLRIRTQETRLYDGSIKNPKDLRQVQGDVEHLKLRLREQEEIVIELMLALDASEEANRAKQSTLQMAESETEQYRAGLMEEKDKLFQQAKVLQVKRRRSIEDIPAADLQTYERLRKAKGGVAVAGVREGLCNGCHVGVPANILRSARTGTDIVLCPSCGRILYPLGGIEFRSFDHDLDNVDR